MTNHGGKRPGAGRKAKPAPDKMKVYSYKATEQQQKQMKANAQAVGMNLSEFIRFKCLEEN